MRSKRIMSDLDPNYGKTPGEKTRCIFIICYRKQHGYIIRYLGALGAWAGKPSSFRFFSMAFRMCLAPFAWSLMKEIFWKHNAHINRPNMILNFLDYKRLLH